MSNASEGHQRRQEHEQNKRQDEIQDAFQEQQVFVLGRRGEGQQRLLAQMLQVNLRNLVREKGEQDPALHAFHFTGPKRRPRAFPGRLW